MSRAVTGRITGRTRTVCESSEEAAQQMDAGDDIEADADHHQRTIGEMKSSYIAGIVRRYTAEGDGRLGSGCRQTEAKAATEAEQRRIAPARSPTSRSYHSSENT